MGTAGKIEGWALREIRENRREEEAERARETVGRTLRVCAAARASDGRRTRRPPARSICQTQSQTYSPYNSPNDQTSTATRTKRKRTFTFTFTFTFTCEFDVQQRLSH
jgi:hypothetical protein